jgi:hypothetical protein
VQARGLRSAQVGPRLIEPRINPKSDLELAYRFVEAPNRRDGDAEVVVSFGGSR